MKGRPFGRLFRLLKRSWGHNGVPKCNLGTRGNVVLAGAGTAKLKKMGGAGY
jgi:hypothetical protein